MPGCPDVHKVLLVSRDGRFASSCRGRLRDDAGVEALLADDPASAIPLLSDEGVDGIILDARGHGRDAAELVRAARERDPGMPLLLLGDLDEEPVMALAPGLFMDMASGSPEEAAGRMASMLEERSRLRILRLRSEAIEAMEGAFLAFCLPPGSAMEDMRVVDHNTAATRLWPLGEDVRGRRASEVPCPGIERHFQEACRMHLETSEAPGRPFKGILPQDGLRHLRSETMWLPEDHMGVVVHDETDASRSRERLEESEEMQRLINESLGENITLLDLDFNIVYTSAAVERIRGYTPEEAMRQRGEDILTPDSLRRAKEALRENLELEGASDPSRKLVLELEEHHKDGSIVLVENTLTFLRDRHGAVTGILGIGRDITERRRQEEELMRSHGLLDFIVANASIGVVVMDRELRLTFVSRKFLEDFDLDGREVAGMRLGEALPVMGSEWAEAGERGLRGISSRSDRERVPREGGEDLWLRWEMLPWRLGDGSMGGVVLYSEVINEQLERERALRDSERRYRSFISLSGTGAWEHDTERGLHWQSPEYFRMLGMSGEDLDEELNLHGMQWEDLLHPDDRDQAVESYRRYVESGGSSLYENTFRLRHRDGGWRWTLARGRRLPAEDGRPTSIIVGTHIDLTEMVQREKESMEARLLLEDILENLPDATMVVDREGVLTHWNQRMESLTGVDSEDIVGQGDFAYSVPFYGVRRPVLVDVCRGVDHDSDHYPSCRDGDVIAVDRHPATLRGKPSYIWSNARPIYDSEGSIAGAIGSVRDITDRVRDHDALKRLNEKMELMSHVSRHDTMNQVMVIRGYLELIRPRVGDPGLLEHLERLDKAAERIAHHIDFNRVYLELGSEEPRWQRLLDVLPDSCDDPGVSFETDLGDWEVLADAMLEKVFYNLMDNSIRHGGSLSRVSIRDEPRGDELLLVWEDDGRGIAREDKERIFDRGFGRNTGMGMFLIREMLAITGMGIRETGEPGRGARFEILIPARRFRPASDGLRPDGSGI